MFIINFKVSASCLKSAQSIERNTHCSQLQHALYFVVLYFVVLFFLSLTFYSTINIFQTP